jgi:hypothetical protein
MKESYSVFDSFKCNEDLFYTIYDYLRFVKPEKWKMIHSTDDFNYLLPEEVKDLAKDAVNWLETDLLRNVNLWDKELGAPHEWATLYYMTLAYLNTHNWTKSLYSMKLDEREFVCGLTILWLRDNIEKIS